MDLSIPYYEDMTRISNSNIGWFLKKGPAYLFRMLTGKEEGLKLPQLERGSMIHEYILQPDEFWKDYIILDFETPKSSQQKNLCEKYVTLQKVNPLADIDELLLEAYDNCYSNAKSKDKKLQEAKEIVEKFTQFVEYLKVNDTKKVISFADLNMLKQIKENLEKHKKANELLYSFSETFEVHNEFHINWEFPNASEYGDLACKSLLDRLMIDKVNKKIILIDLKTTSDVYNFKHSVEEFDYNRQMAYYWMAIHWYFKNELNEPIENYDVETYIIAIQTNSINEVRVFKLDPQIIESRFDTIKNAIQDIAWHKKNDLWDHTKAYYLNDGIEKLE